MATSSYLQDRQAWHITTTPHGDFIKCPNMQIHGATHRAWLSDIPPHVNTLNATHPFLHGPIVRYDNETIQHCNPARGLAACRLRVWFATSDRLSVVIQFRCLDQDAQRYAFKYALLLACSCSPSDGLWVDALQPWEFRYHGRGHPRRPDDL